MAYRYRSRRSARKFQRQSSRNFVITLFLIALIGYATITWALPSFINGIGFVKNRISPSQKTVTDITKDSSLAPPVLNIPYEATGTAQIDVKGYATAYSKVNLYLDDHLTQTVDAQENGEFAFQNVSLSLGTNNIYAKSQDKENIESLPSKTIKVIYDNEKPPLTLNEPEDNREIQGGDKKVRFRGSSEPEAKVFINNSQVIVDGEGAFVSDQVLNDGDNIFSIKAVDKASNTTEISRRVIYIPQETQ